MLLHDVGDDVKASILRDIQYIMHNRDLLQQKIRQQGIW